MNPMKQHPPSHSPDHGEVTGPVADTPAEPQPGAAAVPRPCNGWALWRA
jgi:hypothetical protein